MEFLDIALTFVTLTLLEIILGIDNIIFLAIITQRLPRHQQSRARHLGLTLAWVTRLMLLATAVWLTHLTKPLFSIIHFQFSVRDIFLILGGLFLIFKSVQEIHFDFEQLNKESKVKEKILGFYSVIIQIALLDIIFSLDSILTAVGLTQRFWLMVSAITIAIIVMLFASGPLCRFIEKNPTLKMLGLSFLILIGTVLIADGFHTHVPRAYLYFAIGFSLFVEILNIIRRNKLMPP